MGIVRNTSLITHALYKIFDPSRIKRFNFLNLVINGIENNAVLPKSLTFGHGGGTVIGSETVFGENVFVGQNVTFGSKRNPKLWVGKNPTPRELELEKTFPTIEDNVKIHANCIVVGGITIGENSVIGAGSFIDRDIPKNSIVYPKQELVIRQSNKENLNHLTDHLSFREEDKDKQI